jgi:hypothetical protein
MENLSIHLHEVKFNVAVEGLTLDSLETTVFEAAQDAGRKAMTSLLEDYDRRLMQERDKVRLRHVGLRPKKLLTRLGAICYRRSRYMDQGKSRCLLDEALKLSKGQRLTLQRSKIEILLSSHSSYRKSQEDIELITGQKRSHEAARQNVIKEAGRIGESQKRELEQIRALDIPHAEPAPSGVAYLEADSTFLRLQRSRKRTSARKIRKRHRKSLEVKLGIGYTGRHPRYPSGARLAQNLAGKFSYVGLGGSFMENFSLLSEKRLSLYKTRHIVFGGDGARWIKEGIRNHFPRSVYVLCRFHLNRAIKQSFAHLKVPHKILTRLIREDRLTEALGFIRHSVQNCQDPKMRRRMRQLHAYIRNNRQGINSLKRIKDPAARALVRNTGAIEPNIDKFISHRFKKRGMSWSKQGALALLKVRETISNGQWDDWWSVQRSRELAPVTPMNPALSSTQMNKLLSTNVPRITESAVPLLKTRGHEHDDLRRRMRELIRIDYKLGEVRRVRPGRGGEQYR